MKAGEFSSEEITTHYLDQSEKHQEQTGSFVEVYRESALDEAKASDIRRSRSKDLSPLDGLPLALKDNMLLAGKPANAGSAILKNYISAYDATVSSKLKAAGCVFIGRTNMDEFAMGSSTESSAHGLTRNPWDTDRIPGGSSGGSAAAVAEGSVLVALGSDTGGSIRQPASFCGVVGMKPTYGRVSRYGLIAMASSLDQIGPLTRSVEDATIMLRSIEGHDQHDSNTVALKKEWDLPIEWSENLKGLKIGLPKEYFAEGLNSDVEQAVRAAAAKMGELGAELVEISLPHAKYSLSVYYVLMPSEVSANLARFDGVRFGQRVESDNLMETYKQTRGQGFGSEVRCRIMVGTYALSSGYYDAYYKKALQVRRLIVDDFRKAYEKCDLLLTPTSPTTAWKIGEKMNDPISMYLADIYTVSANVSGLPAISIPCGLVDDLPVGMQLIGQHFQDGQVLSAAWTYEKARGPFGSPKINSDA